jgi:hypothetical protein
MSNIAESYKPYFDQWPKEAGPKPSQKDLKAIHEAGIAKPGSKTAIAIAMALREKGTTQEQIKAALGTPYRNKLTALVANGLAKRKHVMGGRFMVYKLTLAA